jgi:hypothetical protein
MRSRLGLRDNAHEEDAMTHLAGGIPSATERRRASAAHIRRVCDNGGSATALNLAECITTDGNEVKCFRRPELRDVQAAFDAAKASGLYACGALYGEDRDDLIDSFGL